ncbi:MAG: ribose 5-phosphate isomerase B [Acidobacteriota bacterium]
MKFALGADHAGFRLKEDLRERLVRQGHEVVDHGTNSSDSCDYPDYAALVARDVAAGRADRGLLVCATGVGMSMAANKVRGVRAALGTSPEQVRLTRAHNDANVLTLGARFTAAAAAGALLDVFLETPFDGGRHARRLGKIAALEEA